MAVRVGEVVVLPLRRVDDRCAGSEWTRLSSFVARQLGTAWFCTRWVVFVSWLPSSDPSFFVATVKHGTPFHSTRFFLCLASTLMHLILGGNDGRSTCRCWDATGTFGWLEGHLDFFLSESCGHRSMLLRARAFRRHETVDASPLRSFPGILRMRSSYAPRIDLSVPRSPLGSTLARVHGPSRPTHRSSDPPLSVPIHHPSVSFFSPFEKKLSWVRWGRIGRFPVDRMPFLDAMLRICGMDRDSCPSIRGFGTVRCRGWMASLGVRRRRRFSSPCRQHRHATFTWKRKTRMGSDG